MLVRAAAFVDAGSVGPHHVGMGLRAPLGIDDFKLLREQRAYYVDKTQLIVQLLSKPAQVTLLTRPRRFGKTLNLSMLRYFLEKSEEDRAALFDGLAVWQSSEAREHFGRYPVVWMSFKDVKATTAEKAVSRVTRTSSVG